ncbi:MAG: flagellar motor protein [Deltaproteobacteria bacterium]|nr:flagellar motor protein [Deltaproteobacteria bacterium]
MDRSSVIGILLGVAAIVGGNLIEGGAPGSIVEGTAAAIVLGGTAGATLLSFPLSDVRRAVASLRIVFRSAPSDDPDALIRRIVAFSEIGRRQGLMTLEKEVQTVQDDFFRRALRLSIDGMSPKMLRETMERENATYEGEMRRVAKVYETAGGFAPTIGILGAVLGLIHVMENLSDPSKLGAGIAVAFVATIYGVGSANLILLPLSKKLNHRINDELWLREMILEGVSGIQSGVNPYYLGEKLKAFTKGRK